MPARIVRPLPIGVSSIGTPRVACCGETRPGSHQKIAHPSAPDYGAHSARPGLRSLGALGELLRAEPYHLEPRAHELRMLAADYLPERGIDVAVVERDGRKFIAGYHPAVRFYREDLGAKVKEDFALLKRELKKL